MNKSNFLIIIDSGHGKETPDKCSPKWDDQPQLFEWKWNRELATYLMADLDIKGIPYYNLIRTDFDVCLNTRCHRINSISENHKNTITVSLHGNYFGVEEVNGFEVFTSPGITESDEVAEEIIKEAEDAKRFVMRINNSEKLRNKNARFKILTGTIGNAVLVEAGFYSNKKECAFMQSIEGLNIISSIIAEGLENFILNKIGKNVGD